MTQAMIFRQIKEWARSHRAVIVVCAIAFFFRALLFHYAPELALSQYGLGADGSDYVNEANNILSGHGFSREKEEPFTPDAIRTPLYPLLLAGAFVVFGSFQALLILQIILSSLIPGMVMVIARRMIQRRWLIVLLGLLVALEPHLAFFTTFYASEGFALFFLFAGIVSLLEWFYTGRMRYMLWSAFFFGAATLVRPITFYIHILLVPLLFASQYLGGRKEWKKPLIAFTVVFLLVVSPWLVRNYLVFGSASMGTVGWFNVYTRVAATTIAIDSNTDFYSAYQRVLDELSVRGHIPHPPPVSEREIQDPQFGPVLKEESLRIFKEHPRAFITFLLTAPVSILTQDNTLGFVEMYTGEKAARPPFSPTLYVSQHGVVAGIKALAPYLSGLYILPYIARLFWALFFVLSCLGVFGLWIKGHRFAAVFFFLFMGYITVFTLNAGAQIDARYRLQFLIGEGILAMAGLEYILGKIQKRHAP